MTDKTKEAKNTWVTNPSGRKQFWAAATAAGLDEANVHEVFGVESMYDFPGTLAEAIATVKQWQAAQPPAEPAPPEAPAPAEPDGDGEPEQPADDGLAEKLAYRCQQLPETPIIAWTKLETKAGFVWSFTIHAGLSPELARLAMRQTVEQIRLFEEGAGKMGWLPVADGRDVTAMPQRAAAQPPAAGAGPPAPPSGAPSAPQQGGNGNSVEAIDYLMVTAPKGKTQVEFWRTGRKYAELFWYQGGEALLELAPWLAQAGWTAQHFDAVGGRYDLPMNVRWQQSPKNAKWRDVVAVEPRN